MLHEDLAIVQQCQQILSEWLLQIGLVLHPNKTQITHTLDNYEGKVGFDFLGFTVRHSPAGKHRTAHNTHRTPLGFKTLIRPSQPSSQRHQEKLKQIILRHQAATQSQLIAALNPVITAWSNYFSTGVSTDAFEWLDHWLYLQLRAWTLFFKDRDLLEIDHILPRSQGGKDEFKNLQLLHRHCHDVKSANDGR